jgi:hypothetical protein
MADVWACSQCRSLNQGKDRCYKCRAPRAVGGVAPTALPTIGPSAAVVPNVRYRSSAFRAVLLSVSLMALTTLVVNMAMLGSVFNQSTPTALQPRLPASLIALYDQMWIWTLGLIALTIVLGAAWASRVVANIPALTGTYPKATPRMTFLQFLVPILNLRWIPSILREILRHLDPRGNGDALIAAALLPPLVTGVLYLVLRYILTGAGRLAGLTGRQMLDLTRISGLVAIGLYAVGAVMVVLIIFRIERRSAALAREQAAGA